MDPENPYLGRIVVLITPIFVGIAGWLTQWVADHFPGAPNLDAGELSLIFVAGALAAASAVYKWLDNRGKYEQGVALNPPVEPDAVPPGR